MTQATLQKLLGQRIRQKRQALNLSQEAFANNCNIHRSHMGEIERGTCNLTLCSLRMICESLEVTIEEIFRGIG
jgi:transcriptional regulator with XRE-family HTH domain